MPASQRFLKCIFLSTRHRAADFKALYVRKRYRSRINDRFFFPPSSNNPLTESQSYWTRARSQNDRRKRFATKRILSIHVPSGSLDDIEMDVHLENAEEGKNARFYSRRHALSVY